MKKHSNSIGKVKKKSSLLLFILLGIGIFSAYSQKMPTGMKDSANKRKSNMSDGMMGSPGLVPTDIMIGQAGRWMVGYQVMFDKMNGNLQGVHSISNEKILQNFMASPTDMSMQMHMAMVMYAPTKKLTLMVMAPYIRKSMNHVMQNGDKFNELTKGIGDIELRGLYSIYDAKNSKHKVLLNAGIGLPTGSINQRMEDMRLEYPMQIGSGTVSVMPGITYLGLAKPWGWGVQFIPTLRMGKNSNGYRLGNYYKTGFWAARQLTTWLSLSANADAIIWQNIKGTDKVLDNMDEPTKDIMLQGGKRLDIAMGISLHPVRSFLKGSQFIANISMPVIQSLKGPQLKRRSVIKLGWQREF